MIIGVRRYSRMSFPLIPWSTVSMTDHGDPWDPVRHGSSKMLKMNILFSKVKKSPLNQVMTQKIFRL